MSKLLIYGNRQPLKGQVKVSGAKNAAVAIIPAAILSAAPVRIENLPEINDIKILVEILDHLGVKTTWESPSTLLVDASTLKSWQPPYELVKKLRASY